MTAAAPWAWALLGLGIPVMLAYLHRRKRKTVVVSSALLFAVIAGDNVPTRRALATPRHLLSLAIILLALLAGVFATADLRPEHATPRDYVVVLDTSASMGAGVLGSQTTRLDEARKYLARALTAFGPGDRIAVITSGAQTHILLGFTQDHAKALELTHELEAGGAGTAMPQALRIADALAAADDAQIILISDGAHVVLPQLKHLPQWVSVGQRGPNLGINALVVREADTLGLAELYVEVTSVASQTREAEVAFTVDDMIADIVVDIVPIEVPANGSVRTLHRVKLPEGAVVRATLQNHGDDVLAADDVASAPRRPGGRARVLLVTQSRVSFTAQALGLHPRVDLHIIGPNDRVDATEYDLLVLETALASGGSHTQTWPTAPKVLALGIAPVLVGLSSAKRIAAPEILRWSFDDPLFRFVDLTELSLPRATLITAAPGVQALVDSEQGPIATRHMYEGRQIVYFGFQPHESDLVLRVGFVNLIANAVDWALGEPSRITSKPDSNSDSNSDSSTGDRAAQLASANVLPSTETELSPALVLPGTTVGGFAEREPSPPPNWRWLVWVALALLVLEGSLGWAHRGAVALRTLVRARLRARRTRRGEVQS